MGKIIKRLTNHTQQINQIAFVTPKVKNPPTQTDKPHSQVNYSVLKDVGEPIYQNSGPETTTIKNQFLLTCSDDGTVNLFDFSPFSRETKVDSQSQRTRSSKAEYDDFRVRRSGRRGQADAASNNPASIPQSS